MYTQSEFYAKYKKYSAAQLQLLLPKMEGEKLEVITGILTERGKLPEAKVEVPVETKTEKPKVEKTKKPEPKYSGKKPFIYIDPDLQDDSEGDPLGEFELPEDLEEVSGGCELDDTSLIDLLNGDSKVVKTPKPKKEKSEKKEKPAPVTPEDAKVTSEDSEIQSQIDSLHTIEGEGIIDLISDLKSKGIDVDFIRFLKKGDKVKFQSASNSKYRGEMFEGVVINITDTDRKGKAYCKVKTTKYGTFQKQQSSIVVIERNVEN